MASDRLVISLLGPPEIKVGNKVLRIRRRMLRYIIFYLACQKTPASRESLCELFWPEEEESKSRKNLREVISKIRHDLPVDDLILTEKEYVAFNPEKVEVDVLAFEETITLLRKNLDQVSIGKLTDSVYLTIQESLNLWRNDQFLGGVSTSGPEPFQLWVLNTGENLHYWRQMMIEWLADRCIVIGDLSQAIQWLSLARVGDPGNTEIDSLLLTCLRDLGLWSRAIRFCEVLEKEYNGGEKEMPSSLSDLISHVRLDANSNYTPRPLTTISEKLEKRVFVGRKNELAMLNSLLFRGGILLLKGEAGSGKSKLLREFYEHLDLLPFFLFYESKPGDESKPFFGITEGVRKLIPMEDWEKINLTNNRVLMPFFPEIAKAQEGKNTFADTNFDQRMILEAFSELVAKANRKKRGLLIIDNCQWLDEQSLDTIVYMYDHMAPQKTSAIVFSFRDDIPGNEIEELIIKKLGNRAYEDMRINPFTKEDVAEIYFKEFAKEGSEDVIERLLQLSGGNPRFLQLLLNGILQKTQTENEWVFNPGDLVNSELIKVVKEELEPISDQARLILKSLAIFGEPFSPIIIEKMTGLSEQILIDALNSLVDYRFITWKKCDDGVSRYVFTREIFAEYFLASISPAERRKYHLQAARVILEIEGDGDEQTAILAGHFQEAGELKKAVDYWISAGTFEKNKFNKPEAYKFYQNALFLIKRLGSEARSEQIYRLVNDWGDLALQTDDIMTFANLNSMCLRAGETRNNPRLIGFGKSGLGWVAHSRGYLELAVNFLTQAIDILKTIEDKISLMDAYFRLGTIYFTQQNYIKTIQYYNEVTKISLNMQSSDAMSFYKKASAFLVFANCITGNLKNAKFISDQGFIISHTLGEENYSTQLNAANAILNYYLGNLVAAREGIDAVIPEVIANKLDWWTATLLITSGQTAMELGDLTKCWNIGKAIAQIQGATIQSHWGEYYERYLRAELLLNLGDLESAKKYYEKNLEEPPDKFIRWISKLGVAKVEMRLGKFKASKQLLEAIIQDSSENGFELITHGAKAELLRLAIIQNDPQSFARAYNRHGSTIKHSEYKGIRILTYLLEGQGYLLQGKTRDAKKSLSQALDAAKENQYYWLTLGALRSLIDAGIDQEVNYKEAKRMIMKLEFNCEIPDLKNGLDQLKESWVTEK